MKNLCYQKIKKKEIDTFQKKFLKSFRIILYYLTKFRTTYKFLQLVWKYCEEKNIKNPFIKSQKNLRQNQYLSQKENKRSLNDVHSF